MVEIAQVVTVHTGLQGLPGYTNWYFFGDPVSQSTLDGYITASRTFWESIASHFPSAWRYAIQPDVSILNPADGALQRVMTATPGAQGTFGSTGAYAGGVGACVTWNTGFVHGSKRLRGRTFLVPLIGTDYAADGTLVDSQLTGLRSAASTLAAVAGFGVWGRPRAAAPGVPALTGAWSAATGAQIRDHVAFLKSRRD